VLFEAGCATWPSAPKEARLRAHALGVPLPPADYPWFVETIAPCSSADAVATRDGCKLFSRQVQVAFQKITSPTLAFKTAP
jgi:hypothetical protein